MSKVLIVDDDLFIRELVEQTLEMLDNDTLDIFTAENGEMAVQVAQQEQPHLIIMDVMMPRMNGFEACHAIKSAAKHTPYIVLLTSKGQAADRKRSTEAGADAFLTKPFDPDKLIGIARNALERIP